ncbi:MAG: site-specific DNA-methyltransferase [Lachnospiraceae bacterium]|nr:site-specific DNA-methyltransferase [Lachnospiraceae bacterium]
MENLKMHTPDLAAENYKKLAALFPNAVTETITGYDENGKPIVERAIDADVLRQEISAQVVEGPQERYQFTWPDKKKSVVLANQPIAKTLRLVREKSVGRDGTPGSIDTENIYIEGDNLDALKLLQETYLGKVKMIYIDPPYNTGGDLVYYDDFSMDAGDYLSYSGQFDAEGNRLVENAESNGRFHTDWLNMLYPRIKIAKDFLSDDGVIFISIDDHEAENLKKICNEIFGANCFIAQMVWQKRTSPDARRIISAGHEYILVYVKNELLGHHVLNSLPFDDKDYERYKNPDNDPNGPWISTDCTAQGGHGTKDQFYDLVTPSGRVVKLQEGLCWRYTRKKMEEEIQAGHIWFGMDGKGVPRKKTYLADRQGKTMWTWWPNSEVGHTQEATKEVAGLLEATGIMDFPKPLRLMNRIIHIATQKDSYVMDFFSGSATTAHAVFLQNAKDSGNRKFIMVQVQEACDRDSGAARAGYATMCDIGEDRIRRAGKKIKEESPLTTANLDLGFRVFQVDSSNMEDVYYRPTEVDQGQMNIFADNIKKDRTPEDLLFQVMLDLGVLLSSKIEETVIAGKKVFSVADGYLIACFDRDVTDETVKAIALKHPFYAVFRDAGMANDSVMTNFEQIFETYSPGTQRKVL